MVNEKIDILLNFTSGPVHEEDNISINLGVLTDGQFTSIVYSLIYSGQSIRSGVDWKWHIPRNLI